MHDEITTREEMKALQELCDAKGVTPELVIRTAQEAVDLYAVFDEALNRQPFLVLEIGYTRITDWMVTVWNAQGVSLEYAPKVVQVQCYDRAEALAQAAADLALLYLN